MAEILVEPVIDASKPTMQGYYISLAPHGKMDIHAKGILPNTSGYSCYIQEYLFVEDI